jgi:selenocysteine lyase/cysteine desulfurase/predicted transcriptional regulator YheO
VPHQPRMSPAYPLQFAEPTGYLDFARFGPPSHIVVDTTARLLEESTHADHGTVDRLMRQEVRAKAAAARLAGTDTDHVVLLPNTSLGLFQAAFNAPPGDTLVSANEFPANTYPWARAEQAGRTTVRWLRPPHGHVTPDAVRTALTDDIGTVAVSAVDFRTGYRADLAGIRGVIGERLLVVDGIQGFGVVDEPWPVADVLVVGGQKWLRAGWGTGFAVLSDRALELTRPLLSGWTGAHNPGLFDDEVHRPDESANGWSLTNLSPVTSGAFAAALELVELAGVPAIEREIAERADALTEVLRAAGCEIVSATEPGRRAGIVAFSVPGHPAEAVGAVLGAAGVTATVRTEHVRLSPHVSTTRQTVERLGAALATLTASRPVVLDAGRVSVSGTAGTDALAALVPVVNSLAGVLGPGSEVLLHDLRKLPNSIVAIAGDLTGRSVGGPITDLLLGLIRRGTTEDLTDYDTYAPDGRPVRSSTVFLHDPDGVAIGCLCVNTEHAADTGAPWTETFPSTVDTLQRFLVRQAVDAVGMPVEHMRKPHKSQVVRRLDEAGFFLIRDAVDFLAGELGVTRYTIYNYLNEVR